MKNRHTTDDPDIFNEAKPKKTTTKSPAPHNTPADDKFDEAFEVHDGLESWEDRPLPEEPGKQARSSSLQAGPVGQTGSKKTPYVEPTSSLGGSSKLPKNHLPLRTLP